MNKKIKDKNNNVYTIEVNENTFIKQFRNNQKSWRVDHSVKNSEEQCVGFGHFCITCTSVHEHLNDEEMFNCLISINAPKIAKAINKGKPIESVAYNTSINNCHSLIRR